MRCLATLNIAKEIVNQATLATINRYEWLDNKDILGVCIANASDYRDLLKVTNKDLLFRSSFHLSPFVDDIHEDVPRDWMQIILNEKQVYTSGNELENNINGAPFSPKQFKDHCKKASEQWIGSEIASPCLMTLKQNKAWKKIVDLGVETYFSYWCINTHIKGFINPYKSQLGNYWELIKVVYELLLFRHETTCPIIVTEAGVGQQSNLTSFDCQFLYLIHYLVFGDRLKAVMFYDSAIIQYNHGWKVFI